MLQKIYSIYSDDLSDAQLYIETGENYVACWCKKTGDNKLRAFEFFSFNDTDAKNMEAVFDSARLFSRLLIMPVSSTHFFWNTNEVLCLPPQHDDANFLKANLDLMFGNAANTKIFSASTEQCIVAWRLKNVQQQIAQQNFRGAVFSHYYVQLIKNTREENIAYLFFYPQYFVFISFKEQKLLFAQTRKYNLAEDALYFILNAFKQYNIEKNIKLLCGGFIEERSKLYETLYQYLEGLQLMHADENVFAAAAFKEYSSHYFMPYINYVV